ncbi:MAG: tetratricopeptide repeat protein, partial [Pirellula sp.]
MNKVVTKLLDEATDRENQGLLSEAEKIYRRALGKSPGNTTVLHRLAMLKHRLGLPREAVGLLEGITRGGSADARWVNDLGTVYPSIGNYSAAEACFRRAIILSPGMHEAFSNLSNLLSLQGLHEEAIQQAQRSITINQSFPQAHNNLGNAYFSQRRFELALACYETAVKIAPAYPDAITNLGKCLVQLNRRAEA